MALREPEIPAPPGITDKMRRRLRSMTADADADEADLLRRAVQCAVLAADGVGAMAHLAGQDGDTWQLAAVCVMSPDEAGQWDVLASSATGLAPVRAAVLGQASWSIAWPDPPGAAQGMPAAPLVGVWSVPLTSGGAPVGALSVLVMLSDGEPDSKQKQDIARIAAVVSARLPTAHRRLTGRPPWRQDPAVPTTVDRAGVGEWSWDLETGLLDLKDRTIEGLVRLAGLDPATWDRRIEGWMARIHADDRPGVDRAIETSMVDHAPFAVEYRVTDQEGRVSWLELQARFVVDGGGEPVRMEGTACDVTERHGQGTWLVGLMESHPDPQYILGRDNEVLWLNRAAGGLAEREGVTLKGRVPWKAVPALRKQGLPELIERARATPGVPVTSVASAPEKSRGGLTAYYRIRATDIGGYVAVSGADITEQTHAEQATAERIRRQTDFHRALAGAWEVPDVVQAVADHLLPLMGADGLILHDLTGPAPRLAGIHGYDDDFVTGLKTLAWPERAEAGIAVNGPPQVVEGLQEFGNRWPWLLPLAERGGKNAWAMVPLVTAGRRRVGSCVISWKRPRKVAGDDTAVLSTIGLVLAQALERAAAYEETRHRADRLEAELLPGRLGPLVGVTAAALYRTAAGQIAGHWYDTIRRPGGRTLLVAGDVHSITDSLEAAITMGILRHAVLTYAEQDLPPDEILAHLTDSALRLSRRGPAVTATCLLVEYDATTGRCAVASAGHPPPILLAPGADPTVLAVPAGDPIGIAQLPAEVAETTLPDGAVLLLHTAGLLDYAQADPAPLIEAIRRHAAAVPADGTEAWLTGLCEAVTGDVLHGHPADAAVLTASTRRVPDGHIASWDLPRTAESAATARNAVARTLTDWGLQDSAESAELIVSELVGNCVRYARGIDVGGVPGEHGEIIRLRLLLLDSDAVTVECYDGSEATPRVRHPHLSDEFGRGLQLVAAAAAKRWGTRYTEHGKCVWAVPSSL